MQTILVILFIAGALLYLGNRFFRTRSKKQKGCEKCGTPASGRTSDV